MSLVKDLGETFTDAFISLIPFSEAKKQRIMDKVRERVEYYKPKIEDVFNINLGDVKVKDHKHWLRDRLDKQVQKMINDRISKRDGKLKKSDINYCYSIFFSSYLAEALFKPAIWTYMNFNYVSMRHEEPNIYIPFYWSNRIFDLKQERRFKYLDNDVVHELSHSTWHALDGIEGENDPAGFRLWSEGFASYCADEHLSHIYPISVSIKERHGRWKRGKDIVRNLVKKYGDGILLDIPKRWQEFQKGY